MNFGESLRLWRKHRGINASELSRLSGISRRAIDFIENNETSPSLSTCEAILKPLGLRLSVVEIEPRSYKPEMELKIINGYENDVDLMCNADYREIMISELSSKLQTVRGYRSEKRKKQWRVYSSAGTITVHRMHELYQLKEGKHE